MIFLPEKKASSYFFLTSIFHPEKYSRTNRNKRDFVKRSIYLLVINLLSSFYSAHAQQGQPINLINADELEYSELGGIKLRKLTGHVQLQQNDVTLFCDQANQYLEQNLIDATGNVRIRQSDTINIYGNSLHYDGNTKL